MKIAVWDPQLDADLELLAKQLGKTVDETVRIAVVEKLRRDLPGASGTVDWDDVRRTLSGVDGKRVLDNRSADEVLGYNEYGLFDEEGDSSRTDVEIA